MRRPAAALALGAFLLAGPPVAAEICAVDSVPAATLLLPYFEVDLHGTGTTLFSIVNTVAEAKLTRVTLWSDLGVPVLWFNVYLTGWDVQTIDLRDVLAGRLPRTGGGESNVGDISLPGDFPGCSQLPAQDRLDDVMAAELRAALTGERGPLTGHCAGVPHGDGVARG